ncbi:MAG: type I restriction endonuclease subunit R [Candidatus Moraniibacteriota bacterium]|jgi:type I restriction enzyme, R subunit
MTHQTEQQLENQFIAQLGDLGFAPVTIKGTDELEANLKTQLEKFNETTFTDREFERIMNHLNKGNTFEKAKKLRDRFSLSRDDETSLSVRFFNMTHWCKNEYQVTNQITQVGKYENRYDVTLLINGLPLVQIELKKRGVELKEAFNQIQRYHKHSFAGSLFEYVQIFVISNGVNTKYFSNNHKQPFEQTFFWTDENNHKISKLEDFAEVFLEKCNVSQMIAEYIVLAEVPKIPMILRPYQYYAVRNIMKRVDESEKGGYIWHTTGSGKTLTSFKVSQLLGQMPEIKKVLFVVDRKDLDIQTTREFNSFSDGSVDGTNNTRNLLKQLKDPKRKLIVTTIQKLDRIIARESYVSQIEELRDEKVVIIFDECHRSQFGKTHKAIKSCFGKAQLFGFTGTPIFAQNNVGGVTTRDVFDECLHKYIITNAISDNNVLGFSVEYVGRYKYKEDDVVDADIKVEDIDTREVLEHEDRLSKISDYVLANYNTKTKNGKFNAIFAVGNTEVARKYYTILQEKNKESSKNLKIATIFTYRANEDETNDLLDHDVYVDSGDIVNEHSRDFLENCIGDYNTLYDTNFSTDKFYDYHKDVQRKLKDGEIDLLLVVNMFLTGFDSVRLNTLFVDKNLQYHGLVQAYSRTNRILGSDKPHGNIVCFRNLKENTDKALALFGDENAKEIVFKKPYEKQKQEFNENVELLRSIAVDAGSVGNLQSEEDQVAFIKQFRNLLRIKSSLETFTDFTFDDLNLDEQEFYDYQSAYIDMYKIRTQQEGKDKVSIIDEIDFELELTRRDRINFDYIVRLIVALKDVTSDAVREKKIADILRVFDTDIALHKKKELIEKFMQDNLPEIDSADDVEKEFEKYWQEEEKKYVESIAKEENIDTDKMKNLINEYLYTQRMPLSDDIVALLPEQPTLMESESIITRIKVSLQNFVETFEW